MLAVSLAVLATVPGCSTAYLAGNPKPARTTAASLASTVRDAAEACGALPSFDKATANEIMAGKLTISPFPAVTIDPARSGDIDWRQNPFHHPTWEQDFQSGGWIEMLISGYRQGGPEAGAYLARAETITKSWLRGVPIGDRDPQTHPL